MWPHCAERPRWKEYAEDDDRADGGGDAEGKQRAPGSDRTGPMHLCVLQCYEAECRADEQGDERHQHALARPAAEQLPARRAHRTVHEDFLAPLRGARDGEEHERGERSDQGPGRQQIIHPAERRDPALLYHRGGEQRLGQTQGERSAGNGVRVQAPGADRHRGPGGDQAQRRREDNRNRGPPVRHESPPR